MSLKSIPRLSPLVALFIVTCGLMSQADQVAPLMDSAWLNSNAKSTDETILYHYHPVMVDEEGSIVPWFSSNLGQAYDDALMRTWDWFLRREKETDRRIDGEKRYMFHQVWTDAHDGRGIGGDQVAQFLSSLDLFYNYTGDPAVVAEMRYQADYYLAHSLSPADCLWPHLPFPYNTEVEGDVHTGRYDGDMILGRDITQPDKAGSFAWELIKLYKKCGDARYRDVAVRIANTLASKVQPGDGDHSPLPFKVNVFTGRIGSEYTSSYAATLELFQALNALGLGNTGAYNRAITLISDWLKRYPATTNKWGPFFEDVPGWSDTQINAITYAGYLLDHPEFDPNWKKVVPGILDWAHERLGNNEFVAYKVHVINEQTSYPVPGQSHSSRQSATEIRYWALTGDDSRLRNAIRMLNWATYSIESTGANRYPRDAVWYSDGYGDFWRHILRAMAAAPQLAPDDANHLLESSSIVTKASYHLTGVEYAAYDLKGAEILRTVSKPVRVEVDGAELGEVTTLGDPGWMWQRLPRGGILRVHRDHGRNVKITLAPMPGILKFRMANHRQIEGDSGATPVTLTVSRTAGSLGAVSVKLATVDGTATVAGHDYEAAHRTLSWADGEMGDKTFSVNILGDTNLESNESFFVQMRDATGGAELSLPTSATVEIENDDVPPGNLAAAGCKGWVWRGPTAEVDTDKTAMPAVNDGNPEKDFDLDNFNQPANTYEMAGVTWPVAQNGINRVVWIQGGYHPEPGRPGGNGPFSADFGLQVSQDGSKWTMISGWSVSPEYAYDSEKSSGVSYTFTGTGINGIRGLRIVGKVHTSDTGSWQATGRELQAFADKTWNITASAGANGSITPSGTLSMREAATQTFRIIPAAGYRVANVLVDGSSKGALETYTLDKILQNHAIVASFTPTNNAVQK